MKNFREKIINITLLSIISLSFLLFTPPICVSATDSVAEEVTIEGDNTTIEDTTIEMNEFGNNLTATASAYSDNAPYIFPIKPGSSEWETFQSKDEMLAVCQIPQEKLLNMTTEALLETIMNYPLITDYYAFNTIEDAYETMRNDFNGFQEFFNRQDNAIAITNQYRSTRVLTAEESLTVEAKEFFEASTLEYLFVCSEIAKGKFLTKSSEYSVFKNIFAEKQQQRFYEGIYSSNADILLRYEYEKTNSVIREINPNYTQVFNKIKTPNGTYVSCVYQPDADLTAQERKQFHDQIGQSYPKANRIGDATTKYNCHSYAWYSASTGNAYWIEYPNDYINDGSYYQVAGTPRSGMKIHYYNGNHSAISIGTRIENGAQTHWAKSKWGKVALYEHYITYSPYASGTRNYSR